MVNLIYMDGSGHKVARLVTNRETYCGMRNADENVKNFLCARGGDQKAKGRQLQFNYNDQLPDGVLKGCHHAASTFSHDIDCSSPEEQQRIKEKLLAMATELGLLELSGSANYGLHGVFRRELGKTILENQVRIATLTETEMDTSTHDEQRVMFTGPATPDNLFYLDDAIFTETLSAEEGAEEFRRLKEREAQGLEEVPEGAKKVNKHYRPWDEKVKSEKLKSEKSEVSPRGSEGNSGLTECQSARSDRSISPMLRTDNLEGATSLSYRGILYSDIIQAFLATTGGEPAEGERNVRLYQLAVNLRAICDNKKDVLMAIMPRYGLSETELRSIVDSACKEPVKGVSKMLRSILNEKLKIENGQLEDVGEASDAESEQLSTLNSQLSIKRMPQGVRDSIDAVGPQLAMPVVTAICPCIGALATGVKLDVHGQQKGLNLIAYIAGDFASGKGSIDPVVDAWMSEVKALDMMYQQQEEEWRAKKRAAKNKKEQPEEPKLPVRCLTLNNTVANLAERLANTEGKHAFSFTPEADTVAQKWRSTMSDFSVMLRQSYDGTSYEREARSAEAVNVHIQRLLWNVVMCGTPDALYRVVSNYTDGFQSRIAVARTPDNTFAPLEEKPHVLTELQQERIQQVAHLLPLMQGEVVLPKLEAKGREWLERIRLETMKNDDKVRARQRFRICVTAQRMTCCVMLCKVCETLIQKHGLNGAEAQLKQKATLWKELLTKAQTVQMLTVFDTIADALLENALHFFRDRIENAFMSRDYAGSERQRTGKNDSIFERLDVLFTYEHAFQQSVAVKGAHVTHNAVQQMLKNWRRQGLIVKDEGRFRKVKV